MGGGSFFARERRGFATLLAKPLRQPSAATSASLTVGEAFLVSDTFLLIESESMTQGFASMKTKCFTDAKIKIPNC